MTPCIEWPGARGRDGYGWKWFEGGPKGAHRVAYIQHHGLTLADIKGQVVRHRCDNPGCVNPEHLVLGSHKDNAQDMVERKRTTGQKLTFEQAAEIRSSAKSVRNVELAQQYGVDPSQISRIRRGLHFIDERGVF